jgi:NSS family neurotransmitter:Na+ symporter
MSSTRGSWRTRVGFILAAVGSAVGLGNVWRFPWMTADNGGAAFLVVYLVVVVGAGVPGLLAEFVIGRRSGRNPVGALESPSNSRAWSAFGHVYVLTAVLLLSFYSVVGGWILRYVGASALGSYFAAPGAYFGSIDYGPEAVALHAVFLLVTAVIVAGGVRDGIERATTVMMPVVVVLLVALAAWGLTLEGAGAGLAFYLSPDPASLGANLVDVLPAAVGQALFTLSLGAGTMVTYASYLGEDRSLPADGVVIAGVNTAIGVLAGLVVFPVLFALGDGAGTGGPGAVFVSLAGAFATLPYGRVVGVAFFGVVALAALSSAISMLEIPVAFLVDEYDVGRRRATAALTGLLLLTGGVTALSEPLFGFVAGTLVDLLLTAGLAGFCLFAGWVLGSDATGELRLGTGAVGDALARPWLYTVGLAIPVFLAFTLLSGLASLAGVEPGSATLLGLAIALVTVAALALRHRESVL